MIDLNNLPEIIEIGRKGENQYRAVEFDGSAWLAENPGASITIVYKRPDNAIYPVVTAATTTPIVWNVSNADTVSSGWGRLEARLIKGTMIGKKGIVKIRVFDSLTGEAPAPTPPAPDWITTASGLQGEIGTLANLSTDAKNSLVAAVNEIAQRGGSFNLHALSEGTIGDSDELLFYSISENDKRKFTLTALKSKLKAYFDTLYLTSHQSLAAYRTSAAQALIDATKQNATDNTLTTTAKTIVGAINELNATFSTIEDALDTIIELLTDDEEDTT